MEETSIACITIEIDRFGAIAAIKTNKSIARYVPSAVIVALQT
jgi:hypothetical protein